MLTWECPAIATCVPIISRKGAVMEPTLEAWLQMPITEDRHEVGSSSAM